MTQVYHGGYVRPAVTSPAVARPPSSGTWTLTATQDLWLKTGPGSSYGNIVVVSSENQVGALRELLRPDRLHHLWRQLDLVVPVELARARPDGSAPTAHRARPRALGTAQGTVVDPARAVGCCLPLVTGFRRVGGLLPDLAIRWAEAGQ
jgi:hypothetical protein